MEFAQKGYFEAAERELGYGLHGLQDLTAHGQVTPITHTILGQLPDLAKFNPLGWYDTLLLTEGYLRLYLERVGLGARRASPQNILGRPWMEMRPRPPKNRVAQELDTFPQGLLKLLEQSGLRIFVGAAHSSPTALGFGRDLNGNGIVEEEHWVDVNRDSLQQAFEVESNAPDGTPWSTKSAGYSGPLRTIFISESATEDAKVLREKLWHEVEHAAIAAMLEDADLKASLNNYLGQFLHAARRSGAVPYPTTRAQDAFAAISSSGGSSAS